MADQPQDTRTVLQKLGTGAGVGLLGLNAYTQQQDLGMRKQKMSIETKKALLEEAFNGFEMIGKSNLPPETSLKLAQFSTKSFNDATGLDMPVPTSWNDQTQGAISEWSKLNSDYSKGLVSKGAYRQSVAELRTKNKTLFERLEPIESLLKEEVTFEQGMVKQKDQQAFEFKKEKLKASSGGEGGSTFSKIEGRILEKYLGKESLSAEEKSIIDNRLVDPIFAQVLTFYAQDPRNLGKKTAERVKDLETTVQTIRAMQSQGLQINAPGQQAQPPQNIGAGSSTQFKDEAEVDAAFKSGKIKRGDKVVVGGEEFIYQ